MFLLIVLTLWSVFDKFWALISLANLFVILLTKTGWKVDDHSGINCLMLSIFLIVLFTMYFYVRLMIRFKKRIILIILLTAISICSIILGLYFGRIRNSAKDWVNGLGGHKLTNDVDYCTVNIPTYSELHARRGFFDVNFFEPKCTDTKHAFKIDTLPDHLKSHNNIKLLGYPRMENYTHEQREDNVIHMKTVRQGVIDMDDPTIPKSIKDNIEFTVDISNPDKSVLNIHLVKNHTRAASQKKLRDKIITNDKHSNKTRIDKNVLILYIDNLSRNNFLRKLPKTSKWLEQFVDSEENSLELFQYFRYNSVYDHTKYNNNAMYYGDIGYVKNTSDNVFEMYSKNGYVTGFFEDG